MRQSIAKSFPLVYELFHKAGEDPYKILEHTWQTMLDVRTVYDRGVEDLPRHIQQHRME